MSRSLNRAQIIGNLGTEPELRTLANGMSVGCVFRPNPATHSD